MNESEKPLVNMVKLAKQQRDYYGRIMVLKRKSVSRSRHIYIPGVDRSALKKLSRCVPSPQKPVKRARNDRTDIT
jgi:hypothetical protein